MLNPELALTPSGIDHSVKLSNTPLFQLSLAIMAARNRPRGALTKDDATDAHEERNMWSQIVTDIKRLRATHAKAAEIAKAQVDMEAKMGKSESHSHM